jgi:hypothetical protein
MKCLFSICLVLLFSCNSGDNSNKNLPDPLKENPESDALPEDMKVINDSVVVPDTARLDSIPMKDTTNMGH